MKPHDDFENIIRDQFADAESTILPIIRRYGFGEILFNSFSYVQTAVKDVKLDLIPDAVGASLTTINDFLRKVSNEQDKKVLEEIARLLFCALIQEIRAMENGKECLSKSIRVMETTCQIKGYDFDELLKKLSVSKSEINIESNSTKSVYSRQERYYNWLGIEEDLKELGTVLKDKKVIEKPHIFKKLFKPEIGNAVKIQVTPESLEFLVFLFHKLYDLKFISVSGGNGRFVPLMCRLCDNDNQLIKKKANKILEKIKRNNDLNTRLDAEITKILRVNCSKSWEQIMRQS